ncbi:LOW QUALITY PROTEIN: taste receptor type 2 member 40-like [Pelodytes ibericus]
MDKAQKTLPPKFIIMIVIVFIENLAGFTLNMYILLIHLKNWKKGTRLQPYDQIHIAMAVNILVQCIMTVFLFKLWFPMSFDKDMVMLFSALMYYLGYFSYWLKAWLCVYYVTTIANFSHRSFIWLKGNISSIAPKLILVSAVGCFAISLPAMWNVHLNIISEANGNLTTNSTVISKSIYVDPVFQLITASLGCFLPLILSNFCIGHTLNSILKHVWRVTHNDSGFRLPNLQAHIKAARTMILLIFLSLTLYLAQCFDFVSTFTVENTIFLFGCYLSLLFPASEAVIIIQASSKLRKEFKWKAWTGGFLWQHIHRMKNNMVTSGGTPLKSQRNAANAMMRFLVFYTVFYFDICVYVFLTPNSVVIFSLHLVLACSFTGVQSVLLILASSRLKKAWKQMSLFIQCHKILRNALLNY